MQANSEAVAGRERWMIIGVLTLVYIVFAVLLNSVGTVILQSIRSFGVDKEAASILEAFKDLPIAVVSFLVASYLPKFGYRNALLLALSVVALACVTMPLLPSFLLTKVLFFAVGTSFALVKVSTYSTIGLLTNTSNEHASLLNFVEGAFMVGVLAGFQVFPLFIDNANEASLSWLQIYWWLAATCLVAIGVTLTVRFPNPLADAPATPLAEDFMVMLRLLWKPAVVTFVIAAFIYVLIEQGIGTWLPTFNNEILHLPATMSVQAAGIFAAALAVGRFSAGAALQRIDWYWLLLICLAAMSVLMVLALPLAENVEPVANLTWSDAPLAVFVLPMIGLFMAPIYPAVNSVILSSLPKPRHASMTGLIVVFSALGGTTGSFVTGQIFSRFDGVTAFYMLLVPIAVIAAAITLLKFQTRSGTLD